MDSITKAPFPPPKTDTTSSSHLIFAGLYHNLCQSTSVRSADAALGAFNEHDSNVADPARSNAATIGLTFPREYGGGPLWSCLLICAQRTGKLCSSRQAQSHIPSRQVKVPAATCQVLAALLLKGPGPCCVPLGASFWPSVPFLRILLYCFQLTFSMHLAKCTIGSRAGVDVFGRPGAPICCRNVKSFPGHLDADAAICCMAATVNAGHFLCRSKQPPSFMYSCSNPCTYGRRTCRCSSQCRNVASALRPYALMQC